MLIKSEYPWIISTNQQGFVTYKLILSKTCCCEAQLIYSQINRNCRPDRQIFVLELLKTFEINSLFSQVHKFSCVLEGIYEIVTFPQTWQASILHNYHYRSTDPYFFGLDRICKLNPFWPLKVRCLQKWAPQHCLWPHFFCAESFSTLKMGMFAKN